MQSSVLGTIDDPSVRAYIVWVPILPDDSQATAIATHALVTDQRASHFWDSGRSLPPLFAPVLGLPEGSPAWDVYLAYGVGVRWEGTPPVPAYWEHQLGDAPAAPTLDGPRFAEHVRALLRGAGGGE